MAAGQQLLSPNGLFVAKMQRDGNFVVYLAGLAAIWSSGTSGLGDGGFAVMQGDGNFVVYTASQRAVFATSTTPNANTNLFMQDDGNLVIYNRGGRPLWSSMFGRTGSSTPALSAGETLRSGQSLWSADGAYEAVVQGDGNFVVYAPGRKPIFASGTNGVGPATLAMQGDGNLVLYTSGGRAAWATGTGGPSASVVIQTDGNLVVYTGRTPLWASTRKKGAVAATNTFFAGFCTWGAADRWRGESGSYPGFSGDAKDWTTNAQAAGYSVSSAPQPRSAVVFPVSPPMYPDPGHVAWVDSVQQNPDGLYISVTEMNFIGNGGGFNRFSTRFLKHSAELRYILVPYGP